MNGATGALGRQLVQKFAQLGRGLELRDRIQLLEGAGECVGQTPHRTPWVSRKSVPTFLFHSGSARPDPDSGEDCVDRGCILRMFRP